MKNLRRDSSGVSCLSENGILKTGNKNKAGIFSRQFGSVYTWENAGDIPLKGPSPYPDIEVDFNRTQQGQKPLDHLYPNKASGPDDLNASLLKECSAEIAQVLACNVAKCHSMRLTKYPLPKQISHDYSLHNQVLENVTNAAKYLGITITVDLDWGKHTNNVTSKATRTLGFLRWNLTLAPKETKVAA